MSDLHRRVRDHAILAGIHVTTAQVEAIDELLIEERRLLASPEAGEGGVGADQHRTENVRTHSEEVQ
jgi:predicted ATP-grasp superfamily ATP-dependent carboligase